MEQQHLKRGRLIDHIQLVVADLDASRRFYGALLGAVGIPVKDGDGSFFWADEFFVSTAGSAAAQGKLTGRVHLAFQASSRAQVNAAHRAGLAAGGRENGAPGERAYHPGYYAAFLLDPDGNNIEIVDHGAHTRSAEAITISF